MATTPEQQRLSINELLQATLAQKVLRAALVRLQAENALQPDEDQIDLNNPESHYSVTLVPPELPETLESYQHALLTLEIAPVTDESGTITGQQIAVESTIFSPSTKSELVAFTISANMNALNQQPADLVGKVSLPPILTQVDNIAVMAQNLTDAIGWWGVVDPQSEPNCF
ncbi:hypothetical protein A3F03_02300 [Candidatus Roizmanbacteria bacterium RIFCSPHIGHO2_12_FULL_41_11]|uniref:Uncharacterized protein n=3 Tax=Candidatus Roizmaniibacteriota TaxID=1752723 RepID=A0A1F7JQM1_9BACT|nr:MAG: hypothetical protein A3F03_02300 [Candidatus Roizmanbacteria bacterium RIFCSPHIGHO2_12_FULL_41_11]OGK51653.1 MAG: hypothetical protein A2966_04995 [Candidatus Roizmanbacteria bacterium RIFCSPLOWO2_01_FULL_41_22]OGK57913.1 MAG: hypothetical protein A3H86_01570 [Candidatus Roizmanbacteria bacterium RIFCSPLOWO2_02_FULL_41_9]